MNLPPLTLLPPHADLFGWAARTLLDATRERLPDLSGITLVLPNPAGIAALRRALLREAGQPLLGPEITTFDAWTRRGADRAPLSALDARLLLTELLSKIRTPFGAQPVESLAQELFSLFEALSANAPELAQDETRFFAQLERGYGLKPPAALSEQAAIVHQLWRAYLQDTGDRSPAVAQLANLRRVLSARAPNEQIILIGCDTLPAAQLSVLAPALGQGVSLWLQGESLDASFIAKLGTPFIPELPVSARAVAVARAFDARIQDPRERRSPTQTVCTSTAAHHAEHEARCVDIAVREARLAGARDIVIVTEDRRLARRVRALLERAGIHLRDEVGWALSTSAAAASLGHWLDGIEQNFAYRPTLALLKSAFFGAAADDIVALERHVYDEAIASNLLRLTADATLPTAALRQLEQAAREHPSPQAPARRAREWSAALLRSLRLLPLWTRWAQDRAGVRLMRALEELDTALQASGYACDWFAFRRLLEGLLEQQTFMSEGDAEGVRLLNLQQTTGLRCEVLIIAGASAAQFPGRATAQGFFKHEVRTELGLPHWHQQLARQRSRFLALLHAAPSVRLTYAPEAEQTQAIPCPWLQWLLALDLAQADRALAQRAADARSEISADEVFGLAPPEPASAPSVPARLPPRWSARAHQTLVDCPYRFHVRYVLGLDAREAPDQGPDARDYGERVHRILQAFQQQLPGLPSPYEGRIELMQRAAIEARLRDIAVAVFAQDLRQRALARVWAARFERVVPALTLWLCDRAPDWPQVEAEKNLERALSPSLLLYGKVDRLEANAQGEHSILDYKTGTPPKLDDMRSGENVQAVHYALLTEHVVQVAYLDLAFERKKNIELKGDDLDATRAQVAQRLLAAHQQLHAGAPLPANGDDKTCQRCDYAGLCRKGGWRDE